MMSNCKNCGAPLKGGKCEYCGTEYPENIPVHVVDKLAWWKLRLYTLQDFAFDFTTQVRFNFKCSSCGNELRLCFMLDGDEALRPWFTERIKGFTMTERLDFCEKCAARMTHIEFNPLAYEKIEKPCRYLIPHIINDIPFGTRDLRMRVICE